MSGDPRAGRTGETPLAFLYYRLGARFAGLIPDPVVRGTAHALAELFRLMHPDVARIVARQVAWIDGHRADGRITDRRGPFHHFALNIAEFLQLAAGRIDALLSSVATEGEEHLESCRRGGRGTVVLTGHVGNWELAVAWAVRRGVPLLPVYRPHPSARADRFFFQARERLGVRTFVLGTDARPLLAHLRQGGWLAIMGDRDYTGNGRAVEFLGARVRLPVGYLRLAQLAGAWILPVWYGWPDRRRERPGALLRFEEPFTVARGRDDLEAAFLRTRAFLSELIAADPGAWTVFERVLELEEGS